MIIRNQMIYIYIKSHIGFFFKKNLLFSQEFNNVQVP